MKLQPVIGLETHVQLKTKSKLFSASSNDSDNSAPNQNICAIDLGHPGVLPVLNEQAVRFAILLGLALNGKIATKSKFDRKHYFYPDLPKAYQISQFDVPVMSDGHLTFDVPGEAAPFTIKLERLHLEEDAAKNIHGEDGKTYVDYNRAGTPLCEIVTQPQFSSAAQAKAYLQELRLLARHLKVSDANMEKGHLRCDVNISLREVDENGVPLSAGLSPKTEIKNVNSFKAVERVIEYEIKRQTKMWEDGNKPMTLTTRGWNDAKQITEEQRVKEEAADYKFFPEPDLPPMDLTEMTDEIRRQIPELPTARKNRLQNEYGFKADDVKQIVDDPELADFAENALSELGAWLQSMPDITPDQMDVERKKLTKLFSGWLLSKLGGLLAERKIDIRVMKITPENFAEFILLLAKGELTGPNALKVLDEMLNSGGDPSQIMDEMGAKRVDDSDALQMIVDEVIESNPDEAERFRNGDKKLMQFFIGQIMKLSRGNADPAESAKILSQKLK